MEEPVGKVNAPPDQVRLVKALSGAVPCAPFTVPLSLQVVKQNSAGVANAATKKPDDHQDLLVIMKYVPAPSFSGLLRSGARARETGLKAMVGMLP